MHFCGPLVGSNSQAYSMMCLGTCTSMIHHPQFCILIVKYTTANLFSFIFSLSPGLGILRVSYLLNLDVIQNKMVIDFVEKLAINATRTATTNFGVSASRLPTATFKSSHPSFSSWTSSQGGPCSINSVTIWEDLVQICDLELGLQVNWRKLN